MKLNKNQIEILLFLSTQERGKASCRQIKEKIGKNYKIEIAPLIEKGYVSKSNLITGLGFPYYFLEKKGSQALP